MTSWATRSESQVNQYNRLLKEYNDLVVVYNTPVDELNCMYGASDPWHSTAPNVSDSGRAAVKQSGKPPAIYISAGVAAPRSVRR